MKVLLVVLCIAVSAAVASSALAARDRAEAISNCGNVVGANWVFPGAGGKIKGNKYGVLANGVSCAVAKQYAIKLSSTKLSGKVPGHSYPITGGPKGYTCYANPDANGKLLAGSCQIGPRTAVSHHAFSWGGRPG
jgi:hypothetical protein